MRLYRLAAYFFLLRLVKAKRIFLPLTLSFLFTFSMKVFKSGSGLSAMVISFSSEFNNPGSIVAYT